MLPPYIIFGDKTLHEMARAFPQRPESLLNITGVGKEKLAKFGETFLSIIRSYATERGIKEQPSTTIVRVKYEEAPVRVSGTLEETRELVKQGLSLKEIASRRNLVPGTIIQHLEKLGDDLDISHMRPADDILIPVKTAFQQLGYGALGPVFVSLGERYSYEDLRLVRLFLKRGGR